MGASVVGPPSGAVSFLFTDVEGSTRRWEQAPEEMRVALEAHDTILRAAIAERGGFVFSTAGDAFAAAFQSPADAVEAASVAQQGLDAAVWPGAEALRVRMGVHTGVAQQRDDDYFGPTLNRAARLMSAAHGGQTVLSGATRSLIDGAEVLDLGEHRLKDLSDPEHVWQLIVEGLTTEFPPLRTLDAVPGNLPTDPATFVGREGDIEQLMGSLETNRLVTMTGVGGVGKTRLSLQVAADASHHYPQGLWFVELAPVGVTDAVPFRFLETLGLEAEPGRRPVETIAASVGDGAVLLVVDNCEHVLGAAGEVIGELVASCPNLKVLASSRRALGLGGEQVRQILPLDASSASSAATHLFVDRATAINSAIDLTDRLDVVTDICARLDGVPLAIELAAARTRSMSPEDLALRLDERFRLLKGSRSGGGDERHKTLLSTIEWSYDLLDEDQRLLFDRLSVFAGSFTLAAAEQICSDERLDAFDVIDLIDDLVDHSLVVADTAGAISRFRMLQSIREFGIDRLGGDLGALRDSHAEWHAEWVEGIWPRIFTSDEPAAVAELDAGWSDLRAAVVHATGDLRLLGRILRRLVFEALYRAARFEVGDWALAAIAVADIEGADDDDRAVFLAAAATRAGLAGDAEQAVELASAFVELCEQAEVDLNADIPGAVISAAVLAGDLELAARVQAIHQRTGECSTEPWASSYVAGTHAVLATYSGEPEIAARAAETSRRTAWDDVSPTLLASRGWVFAMNSDAPRAEVVAQMEEVIEQASVVSSAFFTSIYAQYLSSLRAEVGEVAQAMTDAAENLAQLQDSNTYGLVPPAVRRAAVLLLKTGRPEAAAQLLGWVDSADSVAATPDLAAEIDELVPKMHEALGPDAAKATESGAALSLDEAVQLAIVALREAATDYDT